MRLLFLLSLSLLAVLIGDVAGLNATEYIDAIEKLSRDEQFLEDYAKWSLELFSQSDYLYGPSPGDFPCPIPEKQSLSVPTSVHSLRPSDIKCVGALGDSLTAGLGAHAITPVGLLLENRGAAWSVGGDHTYKRVQSLPNIIRQYDPVLKGYSTKTSLMFLNGQNASHNGLNVAKSGARSYHMVEQANLLLDRLKNKNLCDWENDWKLITFFIGGNDLCSFCEDVNKHTPANFTRYVRETLDRLNGSNLPRTLVNLVLVLDVRSVKDLNAGGPICQLLHKLTCPCAAFPTDEQAKTLDQWIPQYQQNLIDLVNTGRYDTRDDFTVVVQPFLAQTKLPRKENGKIDFSYFAPDCFHFSGKGHAVSSLSLWNNMLEPVGAKQLSWHKGEQLKCPSNDNPFIFTSKNSPKPSK